jgi:hypothetical protein
MVFKALAAALTLLLVLAGSLHSRATSVTRAAITSLEQRRSVELGNTEPSALREPGAIANTSATHPLENGGLQNATALDGAFNTPKQTGRNARPHAPEPGLLLLLGSLLLMFGLHRGKRSRNSPRR